MANHLDPLDGYIASELAHMDLVLENDLRMVDEQFEQQKEMAIAQLQQQALMKKQQLERSHEKATRVIREQIKIVQRLDNQKIILEDSISRFTEFIQKFGDPDKFLSTLKSMVLKTEMHDNLILFLYQNFTMQQNSSPLVAPAQAVRKFVPSFTPRPQIAFRLKVRTFAPRSFQQAPFTGPTPPNALAFPGTRRNMVYSAQQTHLPLAATPMARPYPAVTLPQGFPQSSGAAHHNSIGVGIQQPFSGQMDEKRINRN